jgi:uncharacterized membrane protein
MHVKIKELRNAALAPGCSMWTEIDSVCWIGIFAQKRGVQEVKSGVTGSRARIACVNPIVNSISFGTHSNAWRPCSNAFSGIRDGVETARKKPSLLRKAQKWATPAEAAPPAPCDSATYAPGIRLFSMQSGNFRFRWTRLSAAIQEIGV